MLRVSNGGEVRAVRRRELPTQLLKHDTLGWNMYPSANCSVFSWLHIGVNRDVKHRIEAADFGSGMSLCAFDPYSCRFLWLRSV